MYSTTFDEKHLVKSKKLTNRLTTIQTNFENGESFEHSKLLFLKNDFLFE